MAGRKTKLTKETSQKIVQLIAKGNYVTTALAIAGVGSSTYYEWIQKGNEAETGIHRDFVEAIKEAEALAEAKRVQTILQHADADWKAAAWYLERKHHERWGRKDLSKVEAEVKGETTINVTIQHEEEEEEKEE